MIDPITRKEQYLAKALDSSLTVPTPITRRELFLAKLAGEDVTTPKPITREEMYLDKIVTSSGGGGDTGEDQVAGILDRSVTSISNANVFRLGRNAIYECSALESIDLPEVTRVDMYSIAYCNKLRELELPKLETVADNGIYSNKALERISLPAATKAGLYAFASNNALVSVDLPSLTQLNAYAFQQCSKLEVIDLPSLQTTYDAFNYCSSLKALVLRYVGSWPVMAYSSIAFTSTPIQSGTGFIYVPSAKLNAYKSASNWSAWANQFRALEDYTVDGTVTGALDMSKI